MDWKEERKDINPADLKYYENIRRIDTIGYEVPDGPPLESSYTELKRKYYRTFKSTYPIPPIKEIMEIDDRLETNFTVTEKHIKNQEYINYRYLRCLLIKLKNPIGFILYLIIK